MRQNFSHEIKYTTHSKEKLKDDIPGILWYKKMHEKYSWWLSTILKIVNDPSFRMPNR